MPEMTGEDRTTPRPAASNRSVTVTTTAAVVLPRATNDRLRAIEEAARFRASVTFDNLDPQPEGPDLLDAIAAYMDRQDDAYEARSGITADRTVQADVRRWAERLRAALEGDTRE